ncbi:MAG TPA: glucose 1-dehydrogenase [Gammaproteobacteria bacterium]|nr:glucose 1-dehydrogenase [Gammaproteobacteria bacterium]
MNLSVCMKAGSAPSRVLVGQRALVTGANFGIGAAIAEALAAAGARVVINYERGPEEAQYLVKKIKDDGGEAIAVQADVSQEHQLQTLFGQVLESYGGIDILVNGTELQKKAALVDMTLQDWDQILRVNLTGQFLCARMAAREYIKQGVIPELSRSAGKILCLSSVHDVIPWPGHACFAASKGGVQMMMKTLAQELAPHKIRVNSISPGAVKTPGSGALPTPEKEAELLQLIPYGRLGATIDVARAAVWLVSDEADYVTGTTLYVDGGMTLYPGFENIG